MMPTMCEGKRCSTGKPKPVTLVAIVVTRKISLHPRRLQPKNTPAITTNPAPMPTRLSTTCTAVNVSNVMPQTMAASSILGGGVRFDLPQELVDAARDLGEEIGG